MDLKEAIRQLDRDDAEHYTSDGQPSLSFLSTLLDRHIDRKEVNEVMAGREPEPVVGDEAPHRRMEEFDRDIASLNKEIVAKQAQMKKLQDERLAYEEWIEEDDFETDQDRRMAAINSQNELRAKEAVERAELMKQLPKGFLQSITAKQRRKRT